MRFLRYSVLLLLLLGLPALAQTGSTQQEATPAAPAMTSIGFGDTLSGTLTSGEPQIAYTFEAEAGQYVTITLTSDAFDSYLYLEDANGTTLAEDDDSAGSLNARIGPFTIPDNGTYSIVASSLSGQDVGDFTLSLESTVVSNIEYGQRLRDSLSGDDQEHIVRFTAQAGDLVSISLESPDFDPYLTLTQASTSSVLISDDDSGDNYNARIGPYEIPETGDYLITVSSYYGDTELGEYALTLNKVVNESIEFDQPVKASISGSDPLNFSFRGEVDQVISVEVNTDDQLDTSVSLISPSGLTLAQDDDSGGRVDPALDDVLLNETGQFYIVVQPSVNRDAKTPVTVTLHESPIPSLDEGPATVYLDSSFTTRLLKFEAEDGDAIHLHLSINSDDSISPEVTVIQNGETLADTYADSIRYEMSMGFDVSNGGTVIVQITDYSYSDVAVEVSLERE